MEQFAHQSVSYHPSTRSLLFRARGFNRPVIAGWHIGFIVNLIPMSATRELQRRLRAEESQPRFEPCLPRPTKEPPSGPGWIHEIKHDGFRILAQRQGPIIRLITRNGYDFSDRFLLIVDAVAALPVRSCIVDGEAIAVDEDGLSVFDLVRNRRQDDAVLLCALRSLTPSLLSRPFHFTPIQGQANEQERNTRGP